jgi:hypothetical protein
VHGTASACCMLIHKIDLPLFCDAAGRLEDKKIKCIAVQYVFTSRHSTMFISFDEIIKGRNASIQVTSDGLLGVVELTKLIRGKTSNGDASSTLRRVVEDKLFPESKFKRITIPGSGNFQKRFVTLQDAIELIMVLPGKEATRVRKHFADIITRYLDGDRTMCTEIKANEDMGQIKSYSNFANRLMKSINFEEEHRANEIPETHYIYATKTTAFPGLIKIGKTCDLSKRMSNLKTATAPAPHVIVAVAQTFDTERDETFAQTFFAERRREGEFFEMNEAEAEAFLATHITAKYNLELAQHIARLQGKHL